MNASFNESAARASLRKLTPTDRARMQNAYEKVLAAETDNRRCAHAERVLALLAAVQNEGAKA